MTNTLVTSDTTHKNVRTKQGIKYGFAKSKRTPKDVLKIGFINA